MLLEESAEACEVKKTQKGVCGGGGQGTEKQCVCCCTLPRLYALNWDAHYTSVSCRWQEMERKC